MTMITIERDSLKDAINALENNVGELRIEGALNILREIVRESYLEHCPENEPECSMNSRPVSAELAAEIDASLGILRDRMEKEYTELLDHAIKLADKLSESTAAFSPNGGKQVIAE